MAQALWALRKDESGEEDLVFTSDRGVRLDHFEPAWPCLEARRASGAVETELPALAKVTTR